MLNNPVLKTVVLAVAFLLWSPAFLLGQSKISPFEKYPFAQWAREGPRTQIPWKVHVHSVGLTMHQRLLAHVEIKIDGREVAARAGRGELMALVEIQDEEGHTYQNDASIKLTELGPEIHTQNIEISWDAFILPGQYQVKLALYCPGTEERSFATLPLKINGLQFEFFPLAWKNLPAVEFWGTERPPDSYFVPAVTGRLNLPVNNPQHKLDVELLVNITNPKQEKQAVLVPLLKTFNQLQINEGKLQISTFDLVHQKMERGQQGAPTLDWPKLKETFHKADASVIDVKALQDRDQSAAFLREEIYQRVVAAAKGPQDTVHAIVIIGGPQFFINQSDWKTIPLQQSSNTVVYYVRYGWYVPRPTHIVMIDIDHDDLPKILHPLKLRVFTIHNPQDLNKALAAIMRELSEM